MKSTLTLRMSRFSKSEKMFTLGAFALVLAAMSGILIAPQVFAQETAVTPSAQLSHTKSV